MTASDKEDHRLVQYTPRLESTWARLRFISWRFGSSGKVLVRKKFTQRQLLLTYTANMQTSLIGLEACSGDTFSRTRVAEARP